MKKSMPKILVALLFISLVAANIGAANEININRLPAKDTLVIALKGPITTLDPQKSGGYNDEIAFDFGYDTLVKMDYDLATVKPSLASSWKASEDGKTYTFYLKKNAKFHSGKALTADDVVYSFRRWLDDKASPTRSIFLTVIKDIRAIDKYTVQFTLHYPAEDFLINMTEASAGIVNEDAIKKTPNYGSAGFDGSGPMKFVQWKNNEYLLLERNDSYRWGSSIYKNQGPITVKYVLIRFIPDTSTRMMDFEAGNIDIVVGDAVPATEIPRLLKSDKVTVATFKQNYYDYIGFNTAKPVLSDKRVRQALCYSIDREEYVQTVFRGYATPSYGPVLPTSPGVWKGLDKVAYKYNPEKAKALLDEAGWKMGSDGFRYKNGQKLEFSVVVGAGTPEYEAGMPMLQAYMQRIGVSLKLQIMDWGALFPYINSGQQDSYIMGQKWRSTYRVLRTFFHSDRRPFPNRFAYANPEVDELLLLGETGATSKIRQDAYDKVQEITNEDALHLPLYHKTGWIGVSRRLVNYKAHAFIGTGTNMPFDFRKR